MSKTICFMGMFLMLICGVINLVLLLAYGNLWALPLVVLCFIGSFIWAINLKLLREDVKGKQNG